MAPVLNQIDRNATVLKARALRRSMSLPEGMLWRELRLRPGTLKFRRQHPLGPYIADFYCAAAKLVIEIDGESHAMGDRPGHDARRDAWMVAEGFRVVRFAARDVMKDIEAVITAIIVACRR